MDGPIGIVSRACENAAGLRSVNWCRVARQCTEILSSERQCMAHCNEHIAWQAVCGRVLGGHTREHCSRPAHTQSVGAVDACGTSALLRSSVAPWPNAVATASAKICNQCRFCEITSFEFLAEGFHMLVPGKTEPNQQGLHSIRT